MIVFPGFMENCISTIVYYCYSSYSNFVYYSFICEIDKVVTFIDLFHVIPEIVVVPAVIENSISTIFDCCYCAY